MKWADFIGAIARTKFNNDSQPKILINLFTRAGSMAEVYESTAKSWINGIRECKVSTYFPNGKIENEPEVFKFFKNRPINKLQQLQNEMRDVTDVYDAVNCLTDDMDLFCWSLVNQFLDILGFPRLDKDIGEMLQQFELLAEKHELDKISVPLEEDSKEKISAFLSKIEANIIKPFEQNCGNTYMYMQILEFCKELERLIFWCTCLKGDMFKNYAIVQIEYDKSIQRIFELSEKIFGARA